MRLPPVSLLRQFDTHRLIPSKHLARGDSVLTRIADDVSHLRDIFDLDAATNDRLLAEHQRLPGIGPRELVFDVPFHSVINAAYCHPHPFGARFSGPERGAWYAAFAVETAQAEVAFHKSVELAEVNWWKDEVTYDDFLADFSAGFHDLRGAPAFARALAPDSYVASQTLAEHLLDAGSMGVVYPSVRHETGTCLACFRPALVMNVRREATWRFTWDGTTTPVVRRQRRREG